MTKPSGRRKLVLIVATMMVPLLFLSWIEGCASFAVVALNTRHHSLQALREHTRYDSELGWVGLPNIDIANVYGPGGHLRTNSQGFRNERDTTVPRPAGQRRILCSGDSVTFGQGVSNEQTWCARLAARRSDLEAVNMGQVGYGVDQAYLWYVREASELDVDLHIFAFITHDFLRMQFEQFVGFGRPVLEISGDELAVTNLPVPKRAYYVPWISLFSTRLKTLRVLELAQRVKMYIVGKGEYSGGEGARRSEDEVRVVISKMFSDLKQHNDQRGRKTLMLYLPSLAELRGEEPYDDWLEFASAEAEALQVPLVNLIDEFSALPASVVHELYLDGYHLTPEGNERAATAVLAHLRSEPALGE